MTSRMRARAIAARCLILLVGFVMLSITFANGNAETITYTYDAKGQLIKVYHGTAGPNAGVTTTYSYDNAANRTSLTSGAVIPTITVNPTSLSGGVVGAAYSATFSATAGTSPYSYATTSGTLPTGLTLSSGGALSGTPTVAGTYSFTITATDAASYTGSRSYSVTISPVTTITLSPTTLPNGTAGTAYSQTITASGGTSPYTFSISSGALPAGLTLSSAGVLSGTPSTAGTYSFTVKATDSLSNTGTQSYSVTIASGSNPVANPDYASTTACGSVTTNVVANDTDPGGNYPLQVTGVVSSTKGTATVVSSTSIEFDASVASGTGSVTYTVANTKGATANGTLTVTISGGVCP